MNKEKPLFGRSETIGLAKRFVDPEYYSGKDVIAMYKVFKQFPDRKFWLNYNLGFLLKSAVWFLGEDGQKRLNDDWVLFHLDIKPQEQYNLEPSKIGEDIKIQKPLNLRDLLK